MTVAVTTTLLSQSTVVAIGGVVSCVVLFVLLFMCVCGGRDKSGNDEVADSRNSIPGTFHKNENLNNVTINVDSSVLPVENGQLPAEPGARNSYRSSGSSPQPGGQRQLPAPPTTSLNSSFTAPEDGEEDYDHLTTTAKAKRSSQYDHIKLTPEGKVEVEGHKKSEHVYIEVKSKKDNVTHVVPLTTASKYAEEEDADYDTLNDGSDGSTAEVKRVSVVNLNKSVEDPYSRLKDEDSGGSFTDIDPYSKVKDDPYSRLKDDLESDSGQSFNPYSKVKDDTYSKVKDDPYSRVKDDPPYSRVKDKEDDPYNRVDGDADSLSNSQIEDPYNKVNESSMEGATSKVIDAYASVEPKSSRNITRTNINQSSIVRRNGEEFAIEEASTNEYAVVMKTRSDATPTPTLQNPFNFQSQDNDPYMLPPEPPRRYNEYAEPDDSLLGSGSQRSSMVQTSSQRSSLIQISSQRSSIVQSSSQRTSFVQNGDLSSPELTTNTDIGAAGTSQQSKKREPPYHKITARESLASINQRLARNTYETVAETEADGASLPLLETENFYATVEGGSGDGVVTNPANRIRSVESPGLDHYAEIGATGVRQSSVPAPPSLDSLHIMTKSVEGKLPNGTVSPKGSNSSSNHSRNVSDQEDITLDPNYQTVRDCISEMAASADPDYESVQEAESRGAFHIVTNQNGRKLIRDHYYEEVKPSDEADSVKKRVLKSHMYEDIDEVKEQQKHLKLNPKSDEVWKKRSDAEK